MKYLLFISMLFAFNANAQCVQQYTCINGQCGYYDKCDSITDDQSILNGINNPRPSYERLGVRVPGTAPICEIKIVNGVKYQVCY